VNQQQHSAFSQSITTVGMLGVGHLGHETPTGLQPRSDNARSCLAAFWISNRHSTLPRSRIAADFESLDQNVLIEIDASTGDRGGNSIAADFFLLQHSPRHLCYRHLKQPPASRRQQKSTMDRYFRGPECRHCKYPFTTTATIQSGRHNNGVPCRDICQQRSSLQRLCISVTLHHEYIDSPTIILNRG